jgi:hypothetical protein
MLILDDILLSPVKGLMWVMKNIHNAAQEELLGEGDTITARLGEIYMMLETGKMTEAEFDEEEKRLLDRLDELEEITRSRKVEQD